MLVFSRRAYAGVAQATLEKSRSRQRVIRFMMSPNGSPAAILTPGGGWEVAQLISGGKTAGKNIRAAGLC
jgi:hypothetical protein